MIKSGLIPKWLLKHRISVGSAIAVLAVIIIASAGRDPDVPEGFDTTSELATFKARRGPMTISVSEGGTIESRDKVIVRSELKSRSQIIYLIDEGVQVKKGDLLVELDSADLIEDKYDQGLMVKKSDGGFVITQEKLEITKNQGQSAVEQAQLEYTFAKQDLEQYVSGDYPKQLKELNARIALAEEDLKRAIDKLKWSKVLFEQKFLSQTELQADELAQKKAELDLELARGDLALLETYTVKRKRAELESGVKQKKMALERVERKARADNVQAQAELDVKQSDLERQKAKLAELEEQLQYTKIYAPAAGMVVYATSAQQSSWRGIEPLAEGEEVREREELIHLPATDSVMATIKIHESNLDEISVDMPVRITLDAFPGRVLKGRVARVAPLPDATSRWVNPDLKVFDTKVHFDNEGLDLRNGMSCKVEVILEEHEDTLYVPVQCVIRIGRQPSVYVQKGDRVEARAVEVGLDNNRMIRVISGLEEGERVLLRPPLEDGAISPEDVEKAEKPASDNAA